MTLKWLPNALTIARCILAIVVGYTILDFDRNLRAGDGASLMAFLPFALFSFVALTDWLDGWLARKLNAESAFGARLDPIGDKLLSASSLLALAFIDNWSWYITLPTLAIVSRDVLITAMREAMGNPGTMKVSNSAKMKTALVLGGIALVLLGMAISAVAADADTYSPNWVLSRGTLLAGLVMVWVAAVLAVMTAIDYVKGLTASDDDPHQ